MYCLRLQFLATVIIWMILSVELAFIAIAFISLPNLFYRAEYNVPLLLFAAASWRNRISTSAYLTVISWAIDLYRIITLVAYDDRHLDPQRKPLLLISTFSSFFLKLILVIYLIVKNQSFRNALRPAGVLISVAKSVAGQD